MDTEELSKAVPSSEDGTSDQVPLEGQKKNCDPAPMEGQSRGPPLNCSTCDGTVNCSGGHNSTAAANSTCHSTGGHNSTAAANSTCHSTGGHNSTAATNLTSHSTAGKIISNIDLEVGKIFFIFVITLADTPLEALRGIKAG